MYFAATARPSSSARWIVPKAPCPIMAPTRKEAGGSPTAASSDANEPMSSTSGPGNLRVRCAHRIATARRSPGSVPASERGSSVAMPCCGPSHLTAVRCGLERCGASMSAAVSKVLCVKNEFAPGERVNLVTPSRHGWRCRPSWRSARQHGRKQGGGRHRMGTLGWMVTSCSCPCCCCCRRCC